MGIERSLFTRFFLIAGVYQLGDSFNKENFKTRGVPADDLRKVWDEFKMGRRKRISVDVPMLHGWKVYYTRSENWKRDYQAKYGQEFKADEWCPVTKSLSAESNNKRIFEICPIHPAVKTCDCEKKMSSQKAFGFPSIPAYPNTSESQPERKYRMFDSLGISETQLDLTVKV